MHKLAHSHTHTHTNKVHKWSDNGNICIHFSFRLTYYRVCFPFINAGFRMPDELAKSGALNGRADPSPYILWKIFVMYTKSIHFQSANFTCSKMCKGKIIYCDSFRTSWKISSGQYLEMHKWASLYSNVDAMVQIYNS